ncbi:MAG: Gfo/Idh/MocA family protein [Gammaproteobacteria bacterium]
MARVRVAVVGAGHVGCYHASKYAQSRHARLVGVADVEQERAAELAAHHDCRAVADFRELIDQVDAVSVAVPAADHFDVARACLGAGRHVLVEKPIAVSLEQADALLALARRQGCVLQVGHIERFNPVARELLTRVAQPLFIECHRLAPFKPRGTDVDVVMDVMIHDLDLIMALAGHEIAQLDVAGVPVLSPSADIANARVQFAGGCTANITASRVSLKVERKLRVFQRDAYFSADLQKQELTEAHRGPDARILHEHRHLPGDALEAEIDAFLCSVERRDISTASGLDSRRALELALAIGARLADARSADAR